MDWSKAKTILIGVFIFLNSFLLYMNVHSGNSKDSSFELKQSTLKILEKRGVVLDCKVPVTNGEAKMLNYEEVTYNKEKILNKIFSKHEGIKEEELKKEYIKDGIKIVFRSHNSMEYFNENPDSNVNINSEAQLKQAVIKFLKGLSIPIPEHVLYKIEKQNEKSARIVLRQKVGEYILFNEWITADISNKGINHLKHRYINILGSEPGQKKLIPAYKILLVNADNNMGGNIKSIDLGYKINQTQQKNESFISPVWLITTNKGEYYFEATD